MSAAQVNHSLAERVEDATPPEIEALARRYGQQRPDVHRAWNSVLTGLLAHRSIRAYLPDKLPEGALEAIVAAAQSAASSSNLQTWSVVVVEDEARRARLSDYAGGQAHIRQAPLFLVFLSDLSRIERLAGEADRPVEGLRYLETFLISAIDAALAAQNAVVALESLGLGAVYIGALRNKPNEVARELGLPPHVAPVFGLCVGYPDPAVQSAVKPRLPQRVVVHRETYQARPRDEGIAVYDELLRQFQVSQGLPAVGWVEAVLKRLGSVQALNGRDRLQAELKALGYELR
ncbi:NADPH-dependent oxidoreductase [Bradyrhizobium sp. STM 3562]|uniref:NADPH-dependent oxidoreductase n=1 Tax=Bradyrhizobium sp. STM 3562 TaxID=578924 RepID=UPI00388D9C9B